MTNLSRSVFSGVKWTGLSSAINAIVKLIQVSILAHILPKEAFGMVAIACIFITLGDVFVDMGLTTAVLHLKKISIKQYSTIFWCNVILGLLIALTIICFSGLISAIYHIPELKKIIFWLSINTFVISLSRLHRVYLQKALLFKRISIIEMVGAITMCASSIFLALKDYGVYSLVYGTLISSITISLLLWSFSDRFNKRIKFYFSIYQVSDFLKIGGFQFASSLIEFFSREMDTMFISAFFSTEVLGAYNLCKQLASRLYGVINPIIVKVATPTMALMQDNIAYLTSIFEKMIRIASTINFPIYASLLLLANPIVYYLYGESYLGYVSLFNIFAIYFGFQSVGSFTGVLVVSLGKTKNSFIWSMYRVISVALICFLCRNFDFIWFVFMLTIGQIIVNSYPSFKLTIGSLIPFKFSKYITIQIVPAFCAFGIAATLLIIGGTFFSYYNVIYCILTWLIFIASYIYLISKYNKETIIFLTAKLGLKSLFSNQ